MSRNSNKLRGNENPNYNGGEGGSKNQPPTADPKPPPRQQNVTKENPFGLSFVVPTEYVSLPSEARYYAEGSSLFQKSKIEIRHMTAKDEDVLSSGAGESGANSVFNKLLRSLLVDKEINPEDFLEEDKMAVLLTARVTGYGPHYTTKVFCQNCNDQTVHKFDLSKKTTNKPKKEIVLTTEIEAEDSEENKDVIYFNPQTNSFVCTLPVSDIRLELINLTRDIMDNIEKERRQKNKHNLNFNYTLSYLENIIMTANGVSDPNLIRQLLQVLPAADASYLKDFYNDCYPNMSTMQEVTCSECGTTSEREAPLSWALFRTDL